MRLYWGRGQRVYFYGGWWEVERVGPRSGGISRTPVRPGTHISFSKPYLGESGSWQCCKLRPRWRWRQFCRPFGLLQFLSYRISNRSLSCISQVISSSNIYMSTNARPFILINELLIMNGKSKEESGLWMMEDLYCGWLWLTQCLKKRRTSNGRLPNV